MHQKITETLNGHEYKIEIIKDEESGLSVLTELTTKSVIRLRHSPDGGTTMFLDFQEHGPKHIESWT